MFKVGDLVKSIISGNIYEVTNTDEERKQIFIKATNPENRFAGDWWYPCNYFVLFSKPQRNKKHPLTKIFA